MKRRLLSAFLAVMMVLTMAPMAFAADGEVADSTSGSTGADSVDSGSTSGGSDSGETVPAETLQAQIDKAENGATIVLNKNCTEAITIPENKEITLDLAGHTLVNNATAQDKTVADSERKHTITNNGTLTIEDSVGGGVVDNVSHGRAAVYNDVTGNVTINGGSYTRSAEASTGESNSGGNSWYVIHNYGIMNINKGTFKFSDTNVGAFSSLIHNGWYDGSKNTAQKNAVMTINGGDFTQGTGGKITVKNDDYGELSITGGVFTQPQSGYYCIFNWNIAKISGGTINGYVGNAYGNEICDKGDLTISDNAVVNGDVQSATTAGNDSSDKKNLIKITDNAKVAGAITSADVKYVSVSGGYFTVDPTAYCAEGKTGVASGDKKYPFTVGDVVNNVKVVPGGATASAGDMDGKSDVVKSTMETARDAIGMRNTTIEGLAAVGSIEATEIDSAEMKYVTEQLQEQGVSVEGETVTVYIRPYMDITVTDATVENDVITSVAYNIVPRIRKIVSTATTLNDVRFSGEDKNAIRMDCQEPEVTTPITLTLPLPTGFTTEDLKVKHEKDGKLISYHDATYDATENAITFTNDKGFSTFTVLSDARSTSIQFTDKDGNNIGVAKSYGPSNVNDALPTTVAESGYVFNGWKFDGIDSVYTTLTDDLLTTLNGQTNVKATPDFSKRSSNGGSGSSGGSSSGKTTYKVTTSAVNNGGVNASPSSAEKGASITITLSPDKGYKLDKLTVTDGSGKTVSTVKKSDTVYTFTMPASAVNVGVSYVKADATPSETKFNDVSANAWFASAVDYVTGKGMMNGTADNTFSPKANTTRGMVVTVLYRLENQPSTSAASFTDVASGAYYANAVAWANANGIVSGYGSGKFGPNDKVTREQLAAILYRYAQYKKYDVSGANSLDGYADAQSVSSYAVPALQWANAAGVVTGKSGSKLDPKGNATRAEVAAMLMRFCENVK